MLAMERRPSRLAASPASKLCSTRSALTLSTTPERLAPKKTPALTSATWHAHKRDTTRCERMIAGTGGEPEEM